MKLSVFILTAGRRPKLLSECLRTILSTLPPESEVIVVVQGEPRVLEETRHSVADERIVWKAAPVEKLGKARNRLFSSCAGEIVFQIDDDILVPPDLFRHTLECFERDPELAMLGGPNLTPPDSPKLEKLFGAVVTSWFAAPWVRRRYSAGDGGLVPGDDKNLCGCNLAIRRVAIPSEVRFDDELSSNEETLFIYECRKRGLKLVYSPGAWVGHRRRATVVRFAKQILTYGKGRAHQWLLRPGSTPPVFLLPSLSCLVFTILIVTGQWAWLGSLVALHAGLSFTSALSSREIRKLGARAVASSVPLIALMHASYGVGFLLESARRVRTPQLYRRVAGAEAYQRR